MKKLLIPLALLLLAGAVWLLWPKQVADPAALHRHGIQGPSHVTPLPDVPTRTSPSAYAHGPRNAVALWVNDSAASWIGLVHGFKAMGIPVRVVTQAAHALEHSVIVVYPSLTGANTSLETMQRLTAHVQKGGTLIAFNVLGGGMADVFGFGGYREGTGLFTLGFTSETVKLGLNLDKDESVIPLSRDTAGAPGHPGTRYEGTVHPPVAVYQDGTAAILQARHAAPGGTYGHAYAIGLDFGHFMLRARNGRFSGLTEHYVNSYQPKLDTFLRFLKAVYMRGDPDAIVLHPVPRNRAFTALLTHDVDFTVSMNNVLPYAEDEVRLGVPATYFIQAKYVKDYNDDLFFDIDRKPELQRLAALGMEIASHTIAHSNEFRNMPLGTGREAYPAYQPFVKTFETVHNASVSGELRVSKYLLETLSGRDVTSFRPGHLSLPASLPQMLEATGYRYSSSITANEAMTHLPFRMMYDRSYDTETSVYEFPVTVEDEYGKLGDRYDETAALARKIGRYGGLVNVMIHTDVLDHKLGFQRRFIREFKEKAWFGTVSEFGAWWAMRDQVVVNVEADGQGERVVTFESKYPLDGLTLEVPSHWKLVSGPEGVAQYGNRIVLGQADSLSVLRLSAR